MFFFRLKGQITLNVYFKFSIYYYTYYYRAQYIKYIEQQPSVRQMDANPASQQRRRPDIPTIKRYVDPEKVAAVFRACKELRVPVGDDRDESCSDEDGQKQTAGTPAATADGRTTLKGDENSELS